MPDRASVAEEEEAALQAAIAAHDTEAVARLVVEGTFTKVRQLAARAIEDPATLRQLIRNIRGGNDKSVYKILTDKRDALLAVARKLEQLQAEISAVSATIERHSVRHHDPLFGPTLEQLEQRWKAVAADAGPDVRQKTEQAIERSREVIAQHLHQAAVKASRELAAAHAAAEAQRRRELEEETAATASAERARIEEAARQAQAAKQEAEALAVRQIGELVRKAHGALNGGGTRRAAGLRRMIEERLSTAPPLPAHLLTLADRIKSLQQEWRTLGKGVGEKLEVDWQRFDDAAQKAYRPCREHFEAQALARQENFRRRSALLERLAAFEAERDWEQPDWRTVITALSESKQEWRRYSPVDRDAGKPLQEKFAALASSLQSRLDGEYARNLKQKGLLIERAQQLLAGADSRQAGDDVKDLQQKWKAVGPVPRDEDQRLWEEFRRRCDAVFQKRQQEFADHTAELEANKSKALALCEELEKTAALSGPALQEKAKGLSDLRLAFETIGEFPRGGARELHTRFERAIERCEKSLAQQRARDAERSWDDLFDAANHVRAYRLAIARSAESAETDDLRRAAEDRIAAVGRWPKGGLEAIKCELAKQGAGDAAENEAILRKLCIRAEILTDMPTPPEDQPLRREHQVQRLIRSMGQGITADEAQLDTMAIEWIGVAPIDEAPYLALLRRFKRCRQR